MRAVPYLILAYLMLGLQIGLGDFRGVERGQAEPAADRSDFSSRFMCRVSRRCSGALRSALCQGPACIAAAGAVRTLVRIGGDDSLLGTAGGQAGSIR